MACVWYLDLGLDMAVKNLESRHHASEVRFVTYGLKDITEKQRE